MIDLPSHGTAQQPERPRDELGRPLAHGAANRLHLEPFAQFDIATNHRLAVQHLNAGQCFGAHEAWEACWRLARGTSDEEFFKGLSQIGAGYTHARRGNAHGARALLERGAARIARYALAEAVHHGIDTLRLAPAVAADAARCGEAEVAGVAPPAVAPPMLALPA